MTLRKLVGFGASSMQGVGDSAGGFFCRTSELFPERPFINLGIGGNTTRDMLGRMDAVKAAGEHDLVVILGCNDMPRTNDGKPQIRTALQEYRDNLAALLPAIRGERSLFISSFPVNFEQTGLPKETFHAYMTAATEIATANGYDVWDLYSELLPQPLAQLWAPDGIHFNDAGHALIAAGLVERLKAWQ